MGSIPEHPERQRGGAAPQGNQNPQRLNDNLATATRHPGGAYVWGCYLVENETCGVVDSQRP